MYNLYDYGGMIADKLRSDAYYQALCEYTKEGAVVVDVGTGLGIWALIACKLGARKVYAIEASDVIELARQVAVDNGYGDRIEFIHDLSTRVDLPERADLVVSDLHGVLPFFEQSLTSIIDARRRFLRTDGVMIPRAETIWAAVVEDGKSYQRFYGTWDENSYGFNMQRARCIATNGCRKVSFKSDELLSEPVVLATLDYSHLETPNLRSQFKCNVSRTGTAHGLGVWFNSELAPRVSLSNTPGSSPLIFGNLFFPFPGPLAVSQGDQVSCLLRADLVGQDYVWTWETRVEQQGQRSESVIFRQSTFLGQVYSPRQLQKLAGSHVPKLNEEGLVRRFILERMNGDLSLEAIADELTASFPQSFLTFQQSLTEVAHVSKQYSR